MIVIKNLTKRYGVSGGDINSFSKDTVDAVDAALDAADTLDTSFAIENLNFSMKEGEFVSLLGESGSGKSTILNILAGITDDYSGEVSVDSINIRENITRYGGVAVVFQEALLLPHMNIIENVTFGLKMNGVAKAERLKKGQEMLGELGLAGFDKRYPSELSGGQMQRVSIARALVMKPKVLLMDEPFSALHEDLRVQLQKLLKRIQNKYKVTVLFITHDKTEAFYLSDRIAIMSNGSIMQCDTPYNLYNKPNSKFIANFLGITNIYNRADLRGVSVNINAGDAATTSTTATGTTHKTANYVALKSEEFHVISDAENSATTNDAAALYISAAIKDIVFKNGFFHIDTEVMENSAIQAKNKLTVVAHRKVVEENNLCENKVVKLRYDLQDIIHI